MANRKEALKKLAAVSSAMMMAGAMIMATPITAFADEFADPNPEGSSIYYVDEDQTLTDNNGQVNFNYGTVTNNNEGGTIEYNLGQVENNYGTIESIDFYDVGQERIYAEVTNNCPGGVIKTNSGSVVDNQEGAKIGTNYGEVEKNNGEVDINYGLVETNNGVINKNWDKSNFSGTVKTNNGVINGNFTKVETNNGTIYENNPRSVVSLNSDKGIIGENDGTIEINRGVIEENHDYGVVKDNQGTIIANYNGTVGGNKPEHQYWTVYIYGYHEELGITTTYDYSNSDFLNNSDYLEQAEGKKGIIRISPDEEGYRISQGNGAQTESPTCHYELTQDGNDYIVTVTSVTGYTYLTLEQLNLIVEAISQQEDIKPVGPSGGGSTSGGTVTVVVDDSISVAPSGGSQSSGSSSSEAPAGAITISLPRTTAATAVATAGPSVLGASREAARAAALKMAKLTDAQYKDAVIKNLSVTPAGGLFRLETDRISCFDRAMLEAFAKKGNVDMEVLFPLGGKKLSVMIPAGTDINKLLDDKGYCGFLRLLAILGGEIVTK